MHRVSGSNVFSTSGQICGLSCIITKDEDLLRA